jgi:hypothetical protein
MSKPGVPSAVIRAAIDPTGPTHASVYLAEEFGQLAAPALAPRADLLKCPGAQWDQCLTCSRRLAPAAELDQRWIEPSVVSPCTYYANVDVVRSIYTPMTANEIAILAENRAERERRSK